uniref:Pleckstrin homology domain containing, family O member 2 n=1 Tax=Astyanax mexicanus TaxID=7994 RepID=A0A3B1JMU5_ASTMX
MEDGVKEDPAKPKEVKVTGKAGWLKKSSGKILSSYKDRYVHLDKTEVALYDNEDLKNCVERIDLENFDKCHELRGPFQKKHRLILTRTQKSGSKVCNVKLQAQNEEEKEAWIKALNDGINRAKNKIFDEVKIDESLSLEHVTRTRPKGNRGRRPPTRIHMKEASNISPDGIMKLDLDEADSMPNGTHKVSAEESEQKDTKPQMSSAKSFDDIQEEAEEKEDAPQKKAVKPPMPPSKEKKPSEKEESEAPQKNAIMPPMPPSKDKKPSQNMEDEEPGEVMQEKKVQKPPMPPSKENKPSISDNGDATKENASDSGVESEATPTPSELSPAPESTDEAETGESASPKTTAPAPAPPSKDKKPSQAPVLKDKESSSEDDADSQDDQEGKDEEVNVSVESEKATEEKEEAAEKEKEEDTIKTEDPTFTLSNSIPKPQGVMWDSPTTASDEGSAKQDSKTSVNLDITQIDVKPLVPEPAKPAVEVKLTPHSTPESVKKVPPAPPKKKPVKPPVKVEDSGVMSGVAVSTSVLLPTTVTPSSEGVGKNENETKPDLQEAKGDGERKVMILSLSNQGATEESEDVSGAEAEEKSVDSGQISAEDSESGDQVTSSEDKLQGSLQCLDGDTSEDDLESSDSKVPSKGDPSPAILSVTSKTTVESSSTSPAPTTALSRSSKTRSSSTGDLLDIQVEAQDSDIKNLRQKVSLEMKETGKLLGEIGPSSDEENDPEVLLATAMEKLKTADQFLKEAKSFKEAENKSKRTSW